MPNAATAAAMAWCTWAGLGASERCSGEANSASARAVLMVRSEVADRIVGLLDEDTSGIRLGSDICDSAAPRNSSAGRALPAQFGEAVVVDAEVVGDLVHHGPPDLVGDLLLGAADGADLQPVDGDPGGQHPGVIRRAVGERDALVEPQQAGRTRVGLDDPRDVAHQPAEIFWQPVQRRDDHLLETARLDVDHQSQRRALLSFSSPGRAGITQKTRPAGSRISCQECACPARSAPRLSSLATSAGTSSVWMSICTLACPSWSRWMGRPI